MKSNNTIPTEQKEIVDEAIKNLRKEKKESDKEKNQKNNKNEHKMDIKEDKSEESSEKKDGDVNDSDEEINKKIKIYKMI